MKLHDKLRTCPYTSCPDCGSDMVYRQSRENKKYGSHGRGLPSFLGCSQFPECRGRQSLQDATWYALSNDGHDDADTLVMQVIATLWNSYWIDKRSFKKLLVGISAAASQYAEDPKIRRAKRKTPDGETTNVLIIGD